MALITPPFAAPVSGRGAADLLRLGRSEGAAALGMVAAVETALSAAMDSGHRFSLGLYLRAELWTFCSFFGEKERSIFLKKSAKFRPQV